MTGDNDDRWARSHSLQVALNVQPAHAFHVQVQDDAIGAERVKGFKKLAP